MNASPDNTNPSRWPHRVAVWLVCVTFPLIWIGGLVTTYDAGMAVPDWPTTYGYNLFLYPWQTWLFGPWDLFIEHGHRLLGALAGLLAIGLVWTTRRDSRRWLHWLAWGALALVSAQGALGGARVLLNERFLALVHGCVGPAFFAFCVSLAVVTSRRWATTEVAPREQQAGLGALGRLAVITTGLVYLQLILGAQVRHVPVTATPRAFQILVMIHLAGAAAVLVHAVALWLRAMRCRVERRPVSVMMALTVFQVLLGGATWVAKYAFPVWFEELRFAATYTLEAQGFWPSIVTTAHVATGSLILVLGVAVVLRVSRQTAGRRRAVLPAEAGDQTGADNEQSIKMGVLA